MSERLGSGITGRMLKQAALLVIASFWLLVLSAAPGMRWAADAIPWLWGAALVSAGVAAGFMLRDSRDPELREDRFRAEIVRKVEEERARIHAGDALRQWSMLSVGEMRHLALSLPGIVRHDYHAGLSGRGSHYFTVELPGGGQWGVWVVDEPDAVAGALKMIRDAWEGQARQLPLVAISPTRWLMPEDPSIDERVAQIAQAVKTTCREVEDLAEAVRRLAGT